jgi:hypothetical protein
MAKLKLKTDDGLSLHFGPAKANIEDDSFSFKFKGFKAEGTIDGNTIDGTLKLRGTKLDLDGMFDPVGPTYSFGGSAGPYSVAAEATLSPVDASGTVQVNGSTFNFDLNF